MRMSSPAGQDGRQTFPRQSGSRGCLVIGDPNTGGGDTEQARADDVSQFSTTIYAASTWVLPLLLAITLHEAAHGYVAHRFGDDTAWRLGRVSFNPLSHVDPFGTVLLPALLLVSHSPFLFGYAKPVPVNFRRLRNPRRDMIWVAAAGPAMNLALASATALLIHGIGFLPPEVGQWCLANLSNAITINVFLAVFNMIPLPPLDGGRVAVGLLPNALANRLPRWSPTAC